MKIATKKCRNQERRKVESHDAIRQGDVVEEEIMKWGGLPTHKPTDDLGNAKYAKHDHCATKAGGSRSYPASSNGSGAERRATIGAALGAAHITVNKNSVPNDPRSPFVTSGLRIGSPAVTTRGYREPDCVALANWICDVLDNPTNADVIAGARANVTKQCRQFPVYA